MARALEMPAVPRDAEELQTENEMMDHLVSLSWSKVEADEVMLVREIERRAAA